VDTVRKKDVLSGIACDYLNITRGNGKLLAGTVSVRREKDFLRRISVTGVSSKEVFCTVCYYLSGTGRYELFDGRIVPFSPGKLIVWSPEDSRKNQFHDAGYYVEKYLRFPGELWGYLNRFRLYRDDVLCEMKIGINAEIARRFDELTHELDLQNEKKLPQTGLNMFDFLLQILLNPPGMDQKQISKLEAAKTNPSFPLISKLSDALGVEIKEFFDFDEFRSLEYFKDEFRKILVNSDKNKLMLLLDIYAKIR